MVGESVAHLKKAGKEVMIDLEHFFDGWKANKEYTMQVSHAIFCFSLYSSSVVQYRPANKKPEIRRRLTFLREVKDRRRLRLPVDF